MIPVAPRLRVLPDRRSPRGRFLAAALAAAALLAPAAAPSPARAQSGPRAPEGLDRDGAHRLEQRLRALAVEATPRTVCVYGLIGLGTGCVVDAEGTVVTNAHVAAGARWTVVMTSDGERRLYKRRGIDYEKDLAVLVPETPLERKADFFTLETERPRAGEDLVALGYPGGPRGADPMPTFTYGRAVEGGGNMSVMGVLDYQDAIRTDVPTFSGNSGGPLVDMRGRLVGINGAVDLAHAGNGLAVPAATVRSRLDLLTGGVVRLPGGRSLDPSKNALVRRLEDLLDPVVKRVAEANLAKPVDPPEGAKLLGALAGAEGDPEAAAAFLEAASKTGRNRDLSKLMRGDLDDAPLTLRPEGSSAALPATMLDAHHAVVRASGVPSDAKMLTDLLGRRFEVVARAEEHDLLLARCAEETPLAHLALAKAPAVGTFVAVVDAKGRATAGVISAAPRRISEWNARALAASAGENPIVVKILEGVKTLARLIDQKDVIDVIEQIEAAQKIQRGFAAASTGRGFARVLSHDAPVPPSLAGSPLYDLDGNVVGVHIANAHFGTSYAVPIDAVREAFERYIPRQRGGLEPARRRPAADEPRRAPAPAPGRGGARREF